MPRSLPLEAHHQPPPNMVGMRPSVIVASAHEGGGKEKKTLIKIDHPDKQFTITYTVDSFGGELLQLLLIYRVAT